MKSLTINEIVIATNGKLIKGDKEDKVLNICTDTRKIVEKDLFIPLIGEKFDGHDFILNAYENGARSFLKDKNHNIELSLENASIIEVEDTTKALGDIAKYYKSKFHITYIAVTGSTGKTTTKDMIHCTLSSKYNTLKTEGNFNNHIGLPMTIFNLNDETEKAILEMGMSSSGEIEYLANIVNPDIAVISNIGLSHIENLGSQEGIFKAKLEVICNFTKENTLIINGDDEYLKTLKNKNLGYKLKSFGFEENNDLYCFEYNMNEDGIDFSCLLNGEKLSFYIPARGKHNIYNAMAGILVGVEVGLSIEEIKKGLLNFKTGKMRLDIISKKSVTIINDAYNASPDSMKAALHILNEHKDNRKIAILGDMREMGDYAEKGHRLVGSYAKCTADIIITVGKDSLYIGKEAIEKGFKKENVLHFHNNEEVINYLKNKTNEKDVFLVKGSRGMKMEEIVEFLETSYS